MDCTEQAGRTGTGDYGIVLFHTGTCTDYFSLFRQMNLALYLGQKRFFAKQVHQAIADSGKSREG